MIVKSCLVSIQPPLYMEPDRTRNWQAIMQIHRNLCARPSPLPPSGRGKGNGQHA